MTGPYSFYRGNCPRSVNRDAKYAIRSGTNGSVITVTYVASSGERWLATTEAHPDLVRIVNSIKTRSRRNAQWPFLHQRVWPSDRSGWSRTQPITWRTKNTICRYGLNSKATSSAVRGSTCKDNRLQSVICGAGLIPASHMCLSLV